jgi:hypothetical protein
MSFDICGQDARCHVSILFQNAVPAFAFALTEIDVMSAFPLFDRLRHAFKKDRRVLSAPIDRRDKSPIAKA